MRKALVVGVDYYENVGCLSGCVNDAYSVKSMLDRHSDGSTNFDVKLLVSTGVGDSISRGELKSGVSELFADDPEIALFYFAGHGHIEATGGYLCSSDVDTGDDGLPSLELMSLVNMSKARNKIVILDSCYSGIVGSNVASTKVSDLSEGVTILAATTESQGAEERNGAGLFTSLFVDALGGAAANIVGDITPGGVYAHIDQSLGAWEQRPVFKTNVKSFVSLRKVDPKLTNDELRQLVKLFPGDATELQLDPSYESDRKNIEYLGCPDPDPLRVEEFKVLQNMESVNLVEPVGSNHMYYAAMNSKSCKLTVLGEHYKSLVMKGRI